MELLENTLKELEVRERGQTSLESYYVKDLCQNFKERFRGFDIQDLDSYENYNLQNILDDLRHIQVLLQGSPSKTTFKQKRDFLIRLSREMLDQIKKRSGLPTPVTAPAKGKSLSVAKKEPSVKDSEVKLPPLNTKKEPEVEHTKKPSPPAVKSAAKKTEEQKPQEARPKTPVKDDTPQAEAVHAKKILLKKPSLSHQKSQKIVSLPEISEERATDITLDTLRPTSLNDIDTMILTREQEEMLQKTLKKHGLKPEVWTSYLETKLNNYSNFTHHWHKKHDNKLDIHLELAKFDKEYERYVGRQNGTQRLLYRPSKETSLLKTVLNSTTHTSANRARSQFDEHRKVDHDEYQMSQVRTETDLDEKLNRTASDSVNITPKRKFLPFKLNVSQTPQKSEMVLPSDENRDSILSKPRRDQLSLDFSIASRHARMVSPVLAFNLSPINQIGTGTPNGDSKLTNGLKKVLSLTPKDLDTIKRNHGLTSSVMAISKEVSEADLGNRTLRVSHMNTIDSAILKSPRFNKFGNRSVLKDMPSLQNSHIINRNYGGNEFAPWESSSVRQNNTMKTIYSSKTGTTVVSQMDASSKLLLSTKSPGFSGIKVSEVIDLEYANTVRRIHLLGAGSEAKVFLCQIKEFEDIVALKQYDLVKDRKSSFQSYESLKKEFHMLRELSHDNIIKYLSLYKPRRTAYSNCIEFGIIMEYMSGGSMETYIEEKSHEMTFKAKKRLMKQILEGLDYLHQNNIIHRDLKPANILMSEDKTTIKITDFGISIKTENDLTAKRTWVGTPWYMAPEVINQEPYSSKADIWSAGCCFYHLVTGKKPFHNANAIQALMLMVNNKSPLDLCESSLLQEIGKHDGVKELLEACFVRHKSERPTAAKLLAHPMFADME